MQDIERRERLIRNSIDQAWLNIELGPGWEERLTDELIKIIEPIQAENETLRLSLTNRCAINLDDPDSAAMKIINSKASTEFIRQLAEILLHEVSY